MYNNYIYLLYVSNKIIQGKPLFKNTKKLNFEIEFYLNLIN